MQQYMSQASFCLCRPLSAWPFIAKSAGMEQTATSTLLVPPRQAFTRDRDELIKRQSEIRTIRVKNRPPIVNDFAVQRRGRRGHGNPVLMEQLFSRLYDRTGRMFVAV